MTRKKAKTVLPETKETTFDLDDLFAKKKEDRATDIPAVQSKPVKPADSRPPAAKATTPAPAPASGNDDSAFTDLRGAKKRKTTAEGYRVYKDDELRLFDADAGMTDLCPFDCECCY